ncbi:SLC13 family permease [Candidatus Protochlamydia phocaeensis]|uniref:SLC13 family permease n=1 Tax=Candidatus Protochlamydia phocaeensis TaxID=1414722 RepID=UPI000838F3E8|nr:SLC13 family permease [Candidatus Protochlamydia phocaeensis]
MEVGALLIFVLVYLGMILGFWPGFALDRTGIALLGAIAFIELQGISISQAASYIDLSALAILFSFMIISAQFFYGGFYTYIVDRMGKGKLTPSQLLLAVIFISAGLSAVLINDIVCLALTPLIIKVCFQKKINPIPFLLGLACASNIGSALTLIGNPQNLLIGQVLNIPFAHYLKFSLIPCLLGLMGTWMVIKLQVKGKWFHENHAIDLEAIPFDWWQSTKGIATILIILLIFLFTDMPRDQVALIGAGFLLLSRRMASQTMLSFIDWQLLVLFIGLFIVNRSFLSTNQADYFLNSLKTYHIDLQSPLSLTLVAFILSNLVSNVPAVMLLLPFVNTDSNGSLLALSSTLAGNLFIVGSIANLIVISQAARFGIKLNWKIHAKVGFPVTLITFLLAGGWLYLTA